MAKRPRPTKTPEGPRRIPPAEATSEAVERILPKRQLQIEAGDVVITREPVPRVNPLSTLTSRPWQYRLAIYPEAPEGYRIFTAFQHAALAAEQIATEKHARIIYVEEGVPSLLTNYRKAT